MKKITVLFLIISMFLCSISFVGCENTDGDGTVELADGLIKSLKQNSAALLSTGIVAGAYIYYADFSTHLDNLKFRKELRLVKISSSDYYYAVAYYNSERDSNEVHKDFDNFTWVGYKKASDITEYYNEQKIVVAVQVNRSSYYEDIVTEGEFDDTSVERYRKYNPEFKNGKNTADPILYKSTCFFTPTVLAPPIDGVCYEFELDLEMFTHDPQYKIIEIDGEIYMSHATHTVKADGKTSDVDLVKEFGDYYDTLMELMITDEYSETHEDNSVTHYGLFKIDDILNLIKE